MTLRTCPKGHQYNKSSDCPTCPFCESERAPKTGFLSKISAPARRGLESAGINTIEKLSNHTESEVLQLHGVGPSSMKPLRQALKANELKFKGGE